MLRFLGSGCWLLPLCFDSWLDHFCAELGNRYFWFLKGQKHNKVEISLDCLWVQAYLSCMLKRACSRASLESCRLLKKPCWGGLKGDWLADCLLGRDVPSIVYICLVLQAGVLGGGVPLFSSHWARGLWSSLAVPKEAKIPRGNLDVQSTERLMTGLLQNLLTWQKLNSNFSSRCVGAGILLDVAGYWPPKTGVVDPWCKVTWTAFIVSFIIYRHKNLSGLSFLLFPL